MSEIKVDKGVPMPPARSVVQSVYPWADLKEVGDSFFVPGLSTSRRRGLFSCAKRRGVRINTRVTEENGLEGVRVWLVGWVNDHPKAAE